MKVFEPFQNELGQGGTTVLPEQQASQADEGAG
jgi:hypothetical protein